MLRLLQNRRQFAYFMKHLQCEKMKAVKVDACFDTSPKHGGSPDWSLLDDGGRLPSLAARRSRGWASVSYATSM